MKGEGGLVGRGPQTLYFHLFALLTELNSQLIMPVTQMMILNWTIVLPYYTHTHLCVCLGACLCVRVAAYAAVRGCVGVYVCSFVTCVRLTVCCVAAVVCNDLCAIASSTLA